MLASVSGRECGRVERPIWINDDVRVDSHTPAVSSNGFTLSGSCMFRALTGGVVLSPVSVSNTLVGTFVVSVRLGNAGIALFL